MKRKKKKKAAKDAESAHLDGAGSARSFGSAAAGSVPEAFFVAPRNAPRISQPAPGPPRPGRDPPGFFPGEICPYPRVGSPELLPTPSTADARREPANNKRWVQAALSCSCPHRVTCGVSRSEGPPCHAWSR